MINSFVRFEKKFLLNREEYDVLSSLLLEKTVPDRHGESTVCNIYYDTSTHLLIRRSLEKPVYKEKFRLRSYGLPDENAPVFAELRCLNGNLEISLGHAQRDSEL